jgi:HD-GYP domain-containing protein (c-di-GMP phosphodiesterase class II)
VFDALTSERPYKEAFSFDEAVKLVCRASGSHFDPTVVEAFTVLANVLYEELAQQPYEVLDKKLRRSIAIHFGMETPTPVIHPD